MKGKTRKQPVNELPAESIWTCQGVEQIFATEIFPSNCNCESTLPGTVNYTSIQDEEITQYRLFQVLMDDHVSVSFGAVHHQMRSKMRKIGVSRDNEWIFVEVLALFLKAGYYPLREIILSMKKHVNNIINISKNKTDSLNLLLRIILEFASSCSMFSKVYAEICSNTFYCHGKIQVCLFWKQFYIYIYK